MPNASRFGVGCCCTGPVGHTCSGISFPDTMFMRTSFTYPTTGPCTLAKGGTVINSLWTFTHKSGTVWYFDGTGFKTYTGDYWESDFQVTQPTDFQTCQGFACPTAGRQYQIVCNTGRVTMVYYDFLTGGGFPGSPWDELAVMPCHTQARSVGASLYHVLVSHSTGPFQLDFGTVTSFSAVITDV